MPTFRTTDTDRAHLESLLRRHEGLGHLRVKRHGDTLVLQSEYDGAIVKHARLRKLRSTAWALSFADHRGRWEPTPFTGTTSEMLDLTIEQFPWTIAPVG